MLPGPRPVLLLERSEESAAISKLLDDAADGNGGVLMLRGGAGAGKSALLRAAQHEAASRGMLVLTARGSEFEQDFAFGTVRQLFEPVVRAAGDGGRERLFAGSASLCAALFPTASAAASPSDDTSAAMVEGLAWLVAHIAEAHPRGLVLAVDDVQVCDRASLRALVRLALALEQVGVAVVLTQLLGAPGRSDDLITWLAADPRATVMEPQPLSAAAVRRLVAAQLGDSAEDVANACRDVTGGNPFLVGALLAALRSEGLPADGGATVQRVREMVPDAVLRSVTARVRRLGDDAGRLAQAVAILGPGAELDDAAELAGLAHDVAVQQTERLVDEGFLGPGQPLAFCHPLVASAVEHDMSTVRRSELHQRAAAVLRARSGPDERIAAHLLSTPPAGDAQAAAILRRAAAANMSRGGPEGAVPLLRRAMAEPPSPDDRAAVVLELGRAEAAAGDPAARERLQSALDLVADRRERILAMRDLSRLLFMNEHHAEAARMARQAWRLIDEGDPLAPDLLAEYVATGGFGSGTIDADIRVETQQLASRMAGDYLMGRLPDGPATCVQVANMLSGGRGRQSDVRRLIEHALESGPLDDCPPFGLAPIWATLALVSSDCLDLAGRVAETAYPAAEKTGSIHGLGTAAFSVAIVSLEKGALDQAEPECVRAVELTRSGVPATLPWSAGILATTRRLRGDLAGARRAIDIGERTDRDGYTFGIVVYHRAMLALAEGDNERALADALSARDLLAEFHIQDYSLIAWRVPAAAATHQLGRTDEARAYIEEELELARRAEAPKPLAVALMCAAALESDPLGRLALLEEARDLLDGSEGLLVRAQAAYRLGVVQRDTGSESAARESLLDAYDLAAGCGAAPLADRVRAELRLFGARPRRSSRNGDVGSRLTRSQRRIAVLAAAGRSNREIAEQLHLTTSTVEFHLTHAYRKLGIRSRADLARVLAG